MLYAHLYVHITIPTYLVTVIHLLCYFMLCTFVTYFIKLLLLLLLLEKGALNRNYCQCKPVLVLQVLVCCMPDVMTSSGCSCFAAKLG